MHAGVVGEQAEISWRGLYASQYGWRGLHATCFEALDLPTWHEDMRTPAAYRHVPPSCTLDPSALRWTAGGPGSWLVMLVCNRLEVSSF